MVQVIDTGPNPWSQGINRFFQGYTPNAVKQIAQQRKQQNIQELLAASPKGSSLEDIYRAGIERGVPTEEIQELLGVRQKEQEIGVEQSKVDQIRQKAQTEAANKRLESNALNKLRRGDELTQEEQSALSPESQRALLNIQGKEREKAAKFEAERADVRATLKEAGKTDEEIDRMVQNLSPTSAREILKAAKQPQLFESELDKILAKQQGEFRAEALKGYQAAIESEPRINEMERLAKAGKVSTPLMVKALDTFGLPLSVLGNPNTEVYRKLEYDWLKDAQNYFPGQVRVFEAQSFLKSIPGLMVSDEGKKSVLKFFKASNEAKKLIYKTTKDIIKENGNKIPADLDFQTYERLGDQLSKIGETAKDAIREAESIGPKLTMYDDKGNQYQIPSMNSAAIEAAVNRGFKFTKNM